MRLYEEEVGATVQNMIRGLRERNKFLYFCILCSSSISGNFRAQREGHSTIGVSNGIEFDQRGLEVAQDGMTRETVQFGPISLDSDLEEITREGFNGNASGGNGFGGHSDRVEILVGT